MLRCCMCCCVSAAFIDQHECFFGLRSKPLQAQCVHHLVDRMNAAQQKVLASEGDVDLLFNEYCRYLAAVVL